MALTEESKIDKIEVVGGDTDWVHVQVRTKNIVKRDGVKIADIEMNEMMDLLTQQRYTIIRDSAFPVEDGIKNN